MKILKKNHNDLDLHEGELTDRILSKLAVILLTSHYINECFRWDFNIKKHIKQLLSVEQSVVSEADISEKALECVLQFVTRNNNRFFHENKYDSTSICENYAKMPQDTRYIFIADCDVSATNKKMGNADGRYKKWAENVFSFTIPVPDHRKKTPDISIEHLFTDLEIKKEIVCDDGISRRLYMGNEFDQHGHAQSIDRFCERKDICGPNKINVIEGTQGDKIHSFSDSSIENYALPKMKFAKYVCEHPEEFDFSGFVEVFKVIKEIIQDGVAICLNNHQL